MSNSACNRRGTWGLIAALVGLTLVAYLPSFDGKFVFDDHVHIETPDGESKLESMGWKIFTNRRPMLHLSLWMNYRLGGMNEWGYHVFNLAVHLIAGLTLFGLVARTLKLPPTAARYGRSADRLAFVVALIWLVHPLQTQGVTYIVQRCESMMGMCYLLALYCLLRGAQAARPRRWYAAGVAAVCVGMGSKEVMITAPLVMLLFDRIYLSDSWLGLWKRRRGFYLALLLPFLWLLVLTAVPVNSLLAVPAVPVDSGTTWSAGFQHSAISPLEYLGSQPGVILHYLRLSFLPARLCIDYAWPVARSFPAIAVPGLIVLALLAASLFALVRYPRIGFPAISFFLILAPTSSIMPIKDLAFEHRMYLPLASVVLLTVLGIANLAGQFIQVPKRRLTVGWVVLSVVVLLLMTRTFIRNVVYCRPLALWSNVLAANPDHPRALVNYGFNFARTGQGTNAVQYMRKALEADPDPYVAELAHNNLGQLLAQMGDRDAAIHHFRRVTELAPQWGSAYYHLGTLLLNKGDTDAALESLHRADEIRPDDPGCQVRLGMAYTRKGEYDKAREYLHQALELDPVNVRAVLGLADNFSLQGDIEGATSQYEHALQLAPDDPRVHARYGGHLARQGQTDQAIAGFRKALELNPDYKPAATALATLEKQHPQPAQAADGGPPAASDSETNE